MFIVIINVLLFINVFLLLTRVSFLLSTEDSFEVKVANGSILRTQGSCHAVSLKIQGN